ncbi:MAG: aspartate kinase [Bacteroidales bacterium]|nr:aspartate kinase [Bacteroidales bacterium]
MKVFKFGGGVLKTGKDLVRLYDILKRYQDKKIIVVVSAFNRVTKKFENLLNCFFSEKRFSNDIFSEIKGYHYNLVSEIFDEADTIIVTEKLNILFNEVEKVFKEGLSNNYHFEYDRVVSYGELLSSIIIYEFLKSKNLNCKYEDIRKIIITDSVYTEAKVDWEVSTYNINKLCLPDDFSVCITQGFIASDKNNSTTTLGREGSDFTASVLAYSINAEEVVFWKEVEGIYNADPTKTSYYELLSKLSYRESLEQAFYGAKILHPKTIKPLQNKKIPVYVKSFYNEKSPGTNILDISELSPDLYPNIPIYIIKENQILISVSTIDFSFVSEDNLGRIFTMLSKFRIKVNLMQSSAISFSVCVTNNKYKVPGFISELKETFNVLYNDDLSLITIRHYNEQSIEKMTKGRNVLLEQKSRHTVRFVVR